MEAKHVVDKFVNEYYSALCAKATSLPEFLALHDSPASHADFNNLTLSATSHVHVGHEEPHIFQLEGFSVHLESVNFLKALNPNIVATVVGSLHTHEGRQHVFVQTFILSAQPLEGTQSIHVLVLEDVLWRTDAKMCVPSTNVPLQLPNGSSELHDLSQEQETDEAKQNGCGEIASQQVDTIEHIKVENKCPSICEDSSVHNKNLDNNLGDAHEADEESIHTSNPPAEDAHLEVAIADDDSLPVQVNQNAKVLCEEADWSSNPNEELPSEVSTSEKEPEDEKNSEDVERSNCVNEDEAIFSPEEFQTVFPCLASEFPPLPASSCRREDFTTPMPTNGRQQPQFSYASVLNTSNPVQMDSSMATARISYIKSPVKQAPSTALPASTNASAKWEGIVGSSVYIKNLPSNITPARLYNEFKLFGPLKLKDVSLRNHQQGGSVFAFVDFQDVISAQKAIKASPIMIDDQKVYIQEKKGTAFSFLKGGSNKRSGSINNRGRPHQIN